jgi:hypothetical protein
MTRRTFKMQGRLSTKGGILDVPILQFLRQGGIRELIADHKRDWGDEPEAVCLPIVAPDGLNLAVKGSGLPLSENSHAHGAGREFGAIISEISNIGLDIYLLLDPTMNFCNTDALHIKDIGGDSSSAICIGNPRSQELLGAILGTAVDEALAATQDGTGKLRGVVLDVVDLWPMSASNERVEITCFCSSCEKYLSLRDSTLVEKFKTFPNPLNLLLKDSNTGIAHIHDFDVDSTPEYILGLSKQRDYDQIFKGATESTLRAHSLTILDYLKLRNEQVHESIGAIFSEALNGVPDAISRVILCSGFTYDWTSGIFLASLDTVPDTVCTEVWFDPQESDIYLKEKPFRSYMWRRSRYMIDAFLGFAGNVSNPDKRANTGISRYPKDIAREMLRKRFSQAIGASLREQSALASLPPLQTANEGSSRIGFVGVAMSNQLATRYIDGIDIPPGMNEDEGSSRKGVIDQLRRALGDEEPS